MTSPHPIQKKNQSKKSKKKKSRQSSCLHLPTSYRELKSIEINKQRKKRIAYHKRVSRKSEIQSVDQERLPEGNGT